MAIKQRALIKLNTTKNHVLRVMSTGNKAALGEVYRALTEIRALYREGLSQQNYVTYGEICDGLLLAVQKMIGDGEIDALGDTIALCKELLEYLEKETEKEAHFKKEIVFLPYQSAMWDSLESVWKAAYEDKERCNAYVMPIPYADLNPDRSVAEWHCERDQFPKYVPTLDWREIDLKAWHPDVIFYHSPYDDCNLVTSVESRYYSRNLKECADKLVYIPYFVLEEPCTEEGVENFVLTPGVLNADKVVVQSEAMRELYINVLTKKTNQTNREYWKSRISGAGSPKIEKVLTSKKEDFDMPEKWRKLVEGKKVILYNTSLGAMLQNSDKVCDKLRYVFDVFRNRDDVVLWWRPHPLMKSTFHSMRPQYEEEYLSLEKQYIEEGWGIYDDSSDLHRAICWSDAYYGDLSSVMQLYTRRGKPIMEQDAKITEYHGRLLTPNALIVADGDIYCTERFSNGLYKLDSESYQPIFIDKFPKSLDSESFLYHCIVVCDRDLYFIPFNATIMSVFNLDDSSMSYINLPDMDLDRNAKFYHGTLVDRKIILFGYEIDEILVYEVDTGRWESLRQCVGEFKRYIKSPNGSGLYIHDSVVVDNKVYAVSLFADAILSIDFSDYSCFVGILNVSNKGYSGINLYNQCLWLTPYSGGKFIRVDLVGQEAAVFYRDKVTTEWSFLGGVLYENYLFVLPCYAKHCLIINLDTAITEIVFDSSAGGEEDAVSSYVIQNQMIKMFIARKHKIVTYDMISKQFDWKEIIAKNPIISDISGRYTETAIFPLDDFLAWEKWTSQSRKDVKNVGKSIYDLCVN